MNERLDFGNLQAEMTAQWFENVRRTFGDVDAYIETRRTAYLDRWKEAGRFISDGSEILDIGGGYLYDRLINYFKDRRFSYSFRDVDWGAVEAAKEIVARLDLNAPSIEHGFNDSLNFQDLSFDAVFSSHCIEHSMNLHNTFDELYRIIRPGGMLLMGVPFGWELNPAHPYFFGPNEWIALVEDAGFKICSAQISYELAETGADYFIAAKKIDTVGMRRINVNSYLKDNYHFLPHSDLSVLYSKDFTEHEEFKKSIDIHATMKISPPERASKIMPIFYRYDWAGKISIKSGHEICTEDLYAWYPFIMPTAPISVNGPVEIRVHGKNDASRWHEIMFAGYMWC